MRLDLSHVGQVALTTADTDRAERFYEQALGLRKLYRFGTLVFFDCAGLRLMIAQSDDKEAIAHASTLYFRCADIALAVRDHDLWMAFFRDPDEHLMALMQEAPKGYAPATETNP